MSNVAIITGAGSGFGLGLAKELTQRGWIVYATDRDSVALEKAKEFGATARRMDVTNRADIDAVVKEAIADHGRIDLMVANAGYGNFSSVEETTPEEVRRIFEVNVFGVENSIRAVLPQMRKQRSGRIIMTTSVVGHVSLAGLGWYAATKHAVKAVANALRQETRWLGIRVSTVEPGTSKTNFGAVAFGLLESGRAVGDYDRVMAGLNKWLGGLYRISPGPNKTIKTMARAATARWPRAHYPVSWDVRALKLVFYVMPRSWLDGFVLWLAKH